jgi:hypothetical protein
MIVPIADGARIYPLEMPNLANYVLATHGDGGGLAKSQTLAAHAQNSGSDFFHVFSRSMGKKRACGPAWSGF